MILIPSSICENTDSNKIIEYLLTAEHDFGIVILTPSFEKSRKYEENGAVVVNKQGNDIYADQMNNLVVETGSKDKLYSILQREKEAFDYSAIRNYEKAFSIVQGIVNSCIDDEEKGWYLQLAAKYQFHISQTKSNALQVAAFTKNNQLLKPNEGIVYNKLKYETNVSRNQRILTALKKHIDYSELSIHLDEQLSNLSFGVEAEKFEYAFFEIGRLLGYSSQRPDKEIRQGPDVLWCVSANRYVLIECKSEVAEARRLITKSEAGQMEEHGSWFETEYGKDIEALHKILSMLLILVSAS